MCSGFVESVIYFHHPLFFWDSHNANAGIGQVVPVVPYTAQFFLLFFLLFWLDDFHYPFFQTIYVLCIIQSTINSL